MTASLTAIAESLLNPQGRFHTLRDVVPVTDDTPLAPPPPLPRDHPFVASLRLLRREVLLYPDDGRPVRSDLLVEELPQESQPFGDFLRTHLNRNNRRPVRRLLQQLPEMADALPPDREQLAWHGPDNVATASRDGLWYLYDRCGRQLTAEGADWMGDPSEGRLLIRRGGRFGFIGLDGRPVTTLRFDEAYSFRNGRAAVRIRGEWFQIDPDGHRID